MKGSSRRMAAFAVAQWLAGRGRPDEFLPDGPERAFVQDLVYVTVRRWRALKFALGGLLRTWPKGELEALLLVGAAQILYMDDVPEFAAVNETVAAAKSCPNPSIAKVVNGVLRNLLRRRAEIDARFASAPPEERESYPSALVRRWEARFGVEGAARLAEWHNRPAETWLAWRPGAAPEGAEEGFTRLARGRRVADEPGFAEGDFIVQDPATAGAVALLDARPGETVLDFCSAPGGKTVQIGWRLGGGTLVAQEVNPRRRRKLEENLRRCRLDWVRVVDRAPSGETFTRVLVDAPCSNTGVLRRRPDARWNWSGEKLAALVRLQAEILDAAAAFCAPGGTLVYSTCSGEPEENGGQVAAFLARHPEFAETGRRESVPPESGHDGAFACAFVREG